MICSLFDSLANRLRGRVASKVPSRRSVCRPVAPRLEVLEDRWLPSDITTVPTANAAFPLLTLADTISANQPRSSPAVVFLGDSITWGFEYGTGSSLWSTVNAGGVAANYGINGQTTQGLLYQLSLGQLAGIQPAVVVLTIGTNNLLEGDSPQATAAGILADVNAIHVYQPQAQVVVLGVPPGHANPSDPYRQATVQTDALVQQQLAGDPRATFVNIAPALEDPSGQISSLMLYDYIHPTALGYSNISAALFAPIQQAYLTSVTRGV
jgi:lysophospholipase L1-like esterase